MRPWILLVPLLLAGCGVDLPEPPPHGLTVEVLEANPSGEPVATWTDVRPGRWRVEVEKVWSRKAGAAEQAGRAALELHVETLAVDAGWQTHVEVRVRSADGIAQNFVRGFDGLRFHVGHDPRGRPDPSTLRFDARAPEGTRDFLRFFWPAGLPGSTPWFPARSLRVGETWAHEEVGSPELPPELVDAEQARLLLEGGGRLEGVDGAADERVLDVRLAALLTAEGATARSGVPEAVGLGVRDVGRGRFRARDGLPLQWSLVEDVVYGTIVNGVEERVELTLTVEGRTTAQ